jgi:Mg2+ and Co2+ transporter CorA
VMRVLTILSTIILPFVVVSSIYGMNVILPGGQERSGSLGTFVLLIVAMIAIAAGMLLLFRRRHWI